MRNKATVDIQLVIIVRRDANHTAFGGSEVKFFAEKNVGVGVKGRLLGHGAFTLTAKYRDRLASRKARMSYAQGIGNHDCLL